MRSDTKRFLELMERQNRLVAEQQAAKAVPVEPDQVRLQREQERREKWGQLRAREQPSKRPVRTHKLWYIDLS